MAPYHVPSIVAVTTALAAGGVLFGGGGVAPPDAVPIDLPVDRTPTTVAAGGSLTITWPAMGAAQFGMVTAIGVSTGAIDTTRITTRIDGVSVPPFELVFGAIGTLEAPTVLSAPIQLGPTQVFSLLLENTSGGNVDIAARTMGWRAS